MPVDYLPSFEDTLAELEALVDTLDQGDLPLDDSLRRSDHGLAMARVSSDALARAAGCAASTLDDLDQNLGRVLAKLDD